MCTYQKVFLFGIHFFKREKFLKIQIFWKLIQQRWSPGPWLWAPEKKEKDFVWKYQHELVFGKQGNSLEQPK